VRALGQPAHARGREGTFEDWVREPFVRKSATSMGDTQQFQHLPGQKAQMQAQI
jgi:hypothetical protein